MTLFEERLQGLAEDVVTAAVWDPLLHPRARNGQFIKVGGFVRGLFRIGNGSEQKLNGQVLEVRANKRDPKDPLIKVKTKHGDLITPASRIDAASKPKGFLSKLPWAPPTAEEQAYLDRPLDGDVAFVTGVPMEGRDLNGIPLGEIGFDPHTVADVDVGEPPMPDIKKSQSAGVLITEEDGRVWLYEPANHFGGYSTTISKGRVEKGDTVQQAALREAYEELGLVAEITGYLGDYEGSVTNTRLYTGKRIGGAPWSHDFESAEVRLVTPETAATLFNTERDQMILADLTGNTAPLEAWREAHPPPPPTGYDWLKELEAKYGKGTIDWKGHKPPAKWEPKGKGKPLFDPGPTQIQKEKAKAEALALTMKYGTQQGAKPNRKPPSFEHREQYPPELGGPMWRMEGVSAEIREAADLIRDDYEYDKELGPSSTSWSLAETILGTLDNSQTLPYPLYSGHSYARGLVDEIIQDGSINVSIGASTSDPKLAMAYAGTPSGGNVAVVFKYHDAKGAYYGGPSEHLLTGDYDIEDVKWSPTGDRVSITVKRAADSKPLSPIPPSAEPASWKADLESTVQVMSNEGTPLQLEVFNTYEDDGEFVGDISATLANGQEAGFISYSGDEEGVFLDEWETDPEQDEEDVIAAMTDWLKSIGVPLIEQTDIVAEQDTQADLLERTTTAGAARRVIGQVWDELLHPRGKDGRFIEKGGFVRGMFTLPDGTRENMRAEVIAYAPNVGNPDDPIIQVKTADGQKAVALASQVSAVPMTKAELNVSAAQFQLDYFEAKQHFHDVLETQYPPKVQKGKTVGDLLPSEMMEDLDVYEDPPKLNPDYEIDWGFGHTAVGQTFGYAMQQKGATKDEMYEWVESFNATFEEWSYSHPVPYKEIEAWFNDNAPELLKHFDGVISGTGYGLPSDYLYEVEAASTAVGAVLDKEITRRVNVIEGIRLLSVDEFTEQSEQALEDLEAIKAKAYDLAVAEGHKPADMGGWLKLAAKHIDAPHHTPEMQALITQFVAKREELAAIDSNRHDYQTAYAKVTNEVLAELMPGGIGGNIEYTIGKPGGVDMDPGTIKLTSEQEEQLKELIDESVASVYPSWWIEASNNFSLAPTVSILHDRSYYSTGLGTVYLPPNFDNYAQQTAIHEFGHRMEHAVPGLRPLEYAFYWRRNGGVFSPPVKMNNAMAAIGKSGSYKDYEITRTDEFATPYMGRDYGAQPDSFYEIFTMGAEQLITPEIKRGHGSPHLIANDADYRAFILGALVNVEQPKTKQDTKGGSSTDTDLQAEVQDVQFKALLTNGVVANVKRIERDDDGNMFIITTIDERFPASKIIKTYAPGTPDGNKDKEKKAVELLPWKNNLHADLPDQPKVRVRGRDFEWSDMKGGRLYHGTVADLPADTVLEPGVASNFAESAPDRLSVTNDPAVALMWATMVAKERGGTPVVYEVEPVGEVDPWRVTLADRGTAFDLLEGRVAKARIVAKAPSTQTDLNADVSTERQRITALATANDRADAYVDRLIDRTRAEADRLRLLDKDELLNESGPLASLIWKQRQYPGEVANRYDRDLAETISDDPADVARLRTRIRRRWRKIERENGEPPAWFTAAVDESVETARANPKIAVLEEVFGVPTLQTKVVNSLNVDNTPTANYDGEDVVITFFNYGINGAWAGDEITEDRHTAESDEFNKSNTGPAFYRHEYGHHIQYVLSGTTYKGYGESLPEDPSGDPRIWQFKDAWMVYSNKNDDEIDAINIAKPNVEGYEDRVALGKTKISYYSFQNWREGFAEAFRLVTDPEFDGDLSAFSPETQELLRITIDIVDNPRRAT